MKTTRRWNKAANQYYDVLCNMYLYIQRGILIVIIERVWLRRCLTQLSSKSPVAEMVGYEIRSFGK